MTNRWLAVLVMGAGLALPASAQERPKVRAERMPATKTRVWVNGEEVSPLEMVASRRARLGVLLDMQAVQNDSIGATISSVTPGGPAAKAGIRGGDIVTRVNGQRLVPAESARDGDEEESSAALRLIEVMAKLEPGDTVRVEYRRGRETASVNVITSAEPMLAKREFGDANGFTFEIPEMRGRLEGMAPKFMSRVGPGSDFLMNFGGPFADLELAPLNPDLGAYFGAAEGVLVIDAPEKNTFGLKGGDVILSVDGRKARGPSSLLRILRSYEEGDVVKLEILRNKGRQTVTSKIDHKDE